MSAKRSSEPCPHCTGYKVEDVVTPVRIGRDGQMRKRSTYIAVAVTGLIVACITSFTLGSGNASILEVVAVLFFLAVLLSPVYALVRYLRTGPPTRYHQYTCALCGFTWDWAETQPKPQFPSVSAPAASNLMHLGAEHLRQQQLAAAAADEEQRRRRRQQP